MKRSAWVALGLVAMAGGVACGPSKAELASQAKAAADARAAAVAKAAEERVKAEAAKALSLAQAKAAELRAEADRIDVETAKLREALSVTQAEAKAALPGLEAAERAHAACEARARAARDRANAEEDANAARWRKYLQSECQSETTRLSDKCKEASALLDEASSRCSPFPTCTVLVDCSPTEERLDAARQANPLVVDAKARDEAMVADSESRAAGKRAEAGWLVAEAERVLAEVKANPRPAVACGLGRVPIPAGTFMMGESGKSATVAAFCMDRTEVTVAAYDACVKSGKCTPSDTGGECNVGKAGRENHPINCVDWNQATAYCEAQGQRLPTEEEWEYAARGTDGREYPWGNDAPSNQLCWKRASTCPVGAHPNGVSPFGLEDMSGNVCEWTSSPWTDDYALPPDASLRVFRGGGWDYGTYTSFVRSASRLRNPTSVQDFNLGFRCAGSVSAVPSSSGAAPPPPANDDPYG